MMQGDSYNLGFTVKNNAGEVVTPKDVLDVEITIGHLSKTYKTGQLLFINNKWMFPFRQSETFGYWPKAVKAQIRIVWSNGVIEGKPIKGIRVNESISKEVL